MATNAVTYFKGDEAHYTGKTQMVAGWTFYEIVIMEGHLKGQTKLVKNAPIPIPEEVRDAWEADNHARAKEYGD